MNNEKMKVGVIDDDPTILDYYKKVINSSSEMECTMCTSSVENFFKYISSHKDINILLLDINLEGLSGLKAISKIKYRLPKLDIIMITSHSDTKSIFSAFRLGASGYLLKTETISDIRKKILSVKEGGAPISPEVAKEMVNFFNPPPFTFTKRKQKSQLTKTEKLVLNFLVKDLTYQQIGDEMGITINSIRSHVRNIYKKLQVNSRLKIIEKYKGQDFDEL